MKKILTLFIIILLLSSCTRNKDSSTRGSGKARLTFWSSTNPEEIDFAELVVGKWNRENPKVQIRLQPIPEGRSSEEVLLSAIAGKTTPDICANIWPGVITEFVEMGGMVPVDTFPDFYKIIKDRVPEQILKSFEFKDKHYYQIPWKGNPIMMQYNKRMFREAGYTVPPRTYSEFLDAAEKITKDTDGDGQIDQWMGYRDILPVWLHRLFDWYPVYINATKGLTLFNKEGEIIFDNESAVEGFAFFQKIYSNGYFPRTTFQGDALLREKVATQFTGPWNISHTENYKPEGFEYDYTNLPVPDDFVGHPLTYGDYKNIAIFSTCKYPDKAWEFVKFLISKENDFNFLKITSQIPLRKNMINDDYFKEYFAKNPLLRKFAEQAEYTRDVDSIPEIREIFDAITMEYEACCIYGLKTPEKAIRDAVKRCNIILYRF